MNTIGNFLDLIWQALWSIEFFGFGFSCGAFLVGIACINLAIIIFRIRVSKGINPDQE